MEKVDRWLGSRLKDVQAFIDTVYGHDLHAKRVASLANRCCQSFGYLGILTTLVRSWGYSML